MILKWAFSLKVMVVEDECILAMDINGIIRSMGYEEPTTVPTGEEALNKIFETKPDLVLIDLELRGKMSGLELAEKIREMNIPIVYLTSLPEYMLTDYAGQKEPRGYLTKPFNNKDLYCAIKSAISDHEMDGIDNTIHD